MNLSYPHREALVVRTHELRSIRHLTGSPEVRVRAGERVTPDQVIARLDASASTIKLPIAEQLGVSPQDVSKFLMRPIGSTFSAGEALARTRKGLRNVVVAAPVSGTLTAIDTPTGVASLVPGSGGEVRALIHGDVEFVDGKHSISIRTVGARLLGIVGFGEPVRGQVRVVASRPDDELQVNSITPDLAGKIVVAGSWANAQALKKLIEVKAAALICGGFVEREIASGLGLQSDDRLAPWRLAAGDRMIGESLTPSLTVMATEGFGVLPMHPAAFALLKEADGREGVLFPFTRMTGDLMRPELILTDSIEALDDDGLSSHAAFVEGAQVRLADQAFLGKSGTLSGTPHRSRSGDGLVFDVVDVDLAGGTRRTVPIANVEIVS
jgi:hypothetical protein